MPVIVNAAEAHPFLPSLGDPAAIAAGRAQQQDIRPLEIAIINLMADKQATERQLAQWLGHTPLQIQLTFAATDDYVQGIRDGRTARNTPADHIRKFYSAFSDIRSRKFDGLIVTGINLLNPDVTKEAIWPQMQEICEWSQTNVFSSLFLCWGGLAALRHFHDIVPHHGETKTWGVFEHRIRSDETGIMFGMPDVFSVPVSRWKSPRKQDIEKCASLEIVAESDEAGVHLLVESGGYDGGKSLYPRRVYLLNHPEYDTDTLKQEYLRDSKGKSPERLPANYFPDNDPSKPPVNNWRHGAIVYVNWIKTIYEAVPYDINLIPEPWGVTAPAIGLRQSS